jgi:hypothetical protein
MTTLESALRGGRFFASSLTTVGNSASTCNDPCVQAGTAQLPMGTVRETKHTSDPSSKGKRLGGEPSTLVQCTQSMGGNLGGWGPTPFKFSAHNVECKKCER